MAARSSIDPVAQHVLVVDDNHVFLNTLSALLSSLGVGAITRAVNGTDAFVKLVKASQPVDCILCDISMQSGNGLELLSSVRRGQIRVIRPDVCFVLVTANSDPEVLACAMALDASAIVSKPVTAKGLAAAIVSARAKEISPDPARYKEIGIPAL